MAGVSVRRSDARAAVSAPGSLLRDGQLRGAGVHRNERTLGYLCLSREEAPLAVQIFGSEPDVMVEAARMVEDAEPTSSTSTSAAPFAR